MSKQNYQAARRDHWDMVARIPEGKRSWGAYYQHRLAEVYGVTIGLHKRVLEVGCGRGDLLAALQPEFGIGVDFSMEMLKRGRLHHPNMHFVQADAHNLPFKADLNLDAVILSDLINDVWDILSVLKSVRGIMRRHTRCVLNTYSKLWEPALRLGTSIGLSKPNLDQSWVTRNDAGNLLALSGMEVIRIWQEVILPLDIPVLTAATNKVLVNFWPFRHLALTNMIVARGHPGEERKPDEVGVSIVIPARNEAGNIEDILERVPRLGKKTELIFVEGHSEDDTHAEILRQIALHPERDYFLSKQKGEGKWDAVHEGFQHAQGDILLILDADLSVPPEDLRSFFQALISSRAEFVNGVRMVYPMEESAMRFFNLAGNKLFSWVISWLIGQPVKDTLCGTKALWRKDFERMAESRVDFGNLDPFGDFMLILSAAKHNLKIMDLPVRYHRRTYGETNIRRWSHGLMLVRLIAASVLKLKFV